MREAIWMFVRVIVLGLFVSSMADGQPGQAGAITGSVVARADNRPISGAVVTVEGTSLAVVTTALGRFQIPAVPVGTAVLIVRAGGFIDLRVPDVRVQSGATTQVSVELEPTPNFLERVQVTATKTPLSIGD